MVVKGNFILLFEKVLMVRPVQHGIFCQSNCQISHNYQKSNILYAHADLVSCSVREGRVLIKVKEMGKGEVGAKALRLIVRLKYRGRN